MGLVNSAAATASYLQSRKIEADDRLINLGIAGSGNSKLALAGVYPVSKFSVFCAVEIPDSSRFVMDQSYPAIDSANGLHLATSLHPLWNETDKKAVDESAIDLIDMEGYGEQSMIFPTFILNYVITKQLTMLLQTTSKLLKQVHKESINYKEDTCRKKYGVCTGSRISSLAKQ